MTGYELLLKAHKGELKPSTIVRTEHIHQYFDDKDYDYYIYQNDSMFHRCNEKGKSGAKYQDRFLQYKTLEKKFEIIEPVEEDKPIEKIEMVGCNMKVNLLENETLLPTENLQTEFIINKINELIDEINKLKEEK